MSGDLTLPSKWGCDTKHEGVQLQNDGAPLRVQDLHHKDVMSTSNLNMTPEAIHYLIMRFEACKMWSYTMP